MADPVPPPDDGDLPPIQTPVVVEDAQGQQYDADATELDTLLRSGQYQLAPNQYQQGGGVPVVMGGETKLLPADQADAAIRSFEADATSGAALAQAERQALATTPLNQARAASAGWLRGLSFGLSDQALTTIRPEMADELADWKTYNPGLSTGGEIAGMVAPMLAGGAGAVAGGLRGAGAGVRGLAAGAEVVGGGVTRALGGGALARAAGAATRGALEVGAFEAGQEISAAALQKRELDAAKVASAFGHGALIGGAMMGGGSLLFSGAKAVAGAALPAAGRAAEAIGERVAGLADAQGEGFVRGVAKRLEDEMAAKSVGALKKEMREFYSESFVRTGAKDRAVEMAQDLALQSAEKKLALAAETTKKAGAELGAVVDQLSAAGVKADTAALAQGIKSEIESFAGRSGPQYRAAAKELGQWGDDLARAVDDGDIKKLWQFKKDLGDSTVWKQSSAAWGEPAEKAKRSLYGQINDLISRTGEAATDVGGVGFGDAWKAANREYQAAQWVERTLKEKVAANANRALGLSEQIGAGAGLVASGNVLGAVAGGLAQRAIKSFGADVATLAARALRTGDTAGAAAVVDRAVGESVLRYLVPAKEAAKAIASPAGRSAAVGAARQGVVTVEREIAARIFGEAPRAQAPQRQTGRPAPAPVRRKAPTVRDLGAALEQQRDQQRAALDDFAARYPALAPEVEGSRKASERAYAYLISTLPRSVNQKSTLTPQAEQARLTPQQQADYVTRLRVVEQPLSVLESLNAGRLTRIEVEALKATKPELYEQIRGEVQAQLDARTEPLPYRKALEVSLLLGVVGHPSLDPAAVQALQRAYAPPPPPAQPGPPASAPRREINRASDWSLKGEVA